MFYGLSNLKNITIGNGVTSIGNNVFGWCTSIEKIILPNSVTSITSTTFKDCFNLSLIDLGDGLQAIPDQAFRGMWNLRTIYIGKSVTEIGESAFFSTGTLKKVVVAGNLSTIGNASFGMIQSQTGTSPTFEIIFLGNPPLAFAGDPFIYSQNFTIKYSGRNNMWDSIAGLGANYLLNTYTLTEYIEPKTSLTFSQKTNNIYNLKFNSVIGSDYTIESSEDLSAWSSYLTGIRGDDSIKDVDFSFTLNKMFIRVRHTQ